MAYLKVAVLFSFLGASSAMISGFFVPYYGWNVVQTWLPRAESQTLQNLTMWRNDMELFVYNPAVNANTDFTGYIQTADANVNVSCFHNQVTQMGQCQLFVEVTGNNIDDTYRSLQAWGPSNPTTIVQEETLVDRASVPIISTEEGTRQAYRCSSYGIPAPVFVWTRDNVEILVDSNHTMFNETSKFWDSWSVYEPVTAESFIATCTAKQINRVGETVVGRSTNVQVNHASNLSSNLIIATFMVMSLICNVSTKFLN